MAKIKLTDDQQVNEHIQKLDTPLAEIVETLRQIILETDAEIGERIKWNNPSCLFHLEYLFELNLDSNKSNNSLLFECIFLF